MLAVLALGVAPGVAQAQPSLAPTIGKIHAFGYRSKAYDNPTGTAKLVAQKLVRFPGASFVSLELDRVVLGPGSRLELSSVLDASKQSFDARTYRDYGPHSAYFNGDAVLVSLVAGPRTKAQSFAIPRVGVGNQASLIQPASLCGADNRVLSKDPRVARMLVWFGTSITPCSAWLASGVNCFVTAGHCMSMAATTRVTMEFNVPLSTTTGALRFAAPTDQYEWEGKSVASYRFSAIAIGKDWGVLTTKKNAKTGRWPATVQRNWFRFAAVPAKSTSLAVTGHGTDSTPNKTYNQAQQASTGPLVGSSANRIDYRVDTTGGSSGSPVYVSTSGLAIGVHTHGGCNIATVGHNSGTYQGDPSFAAARKALSWRRQQPDLVVSNLVVSPTTWRAGANAKIGSRTLNQGLVPSFVSTTTALYLSTDRTITTADTLLGSYAVAPLAPRASSPAVSLVIRVPNVRSALACYAGAIADSGGKVAEENEVNNNQTMATVTCVGIPDLVVSALSANPAQLVAGGFTSVTHTTRNAGGATTMASTHTSLVLSRDAKVTNSDLLLGSYVVTDRYASWLAPGAQKTLVSRVGVPHCVPPGACWIGAIADHRGAQVEFLETNNTRALAVKCSRFPAIPTWRVVEFVPTWGSSATSTTLASLSGRKGGRVEMCVAAPSYAGKPYVVFSYCTPPANVPHLDFCSSITLGFLNSTVFPRWFGVLDARGIAAPAFVAPSGFLRLTANFTTWTSTVLIDPSVFGGSIGTNYVTTILKP